jgi:hypothetical protein
MLLTNDQKDDVRFHLAYTPRGAIDDGDRALLEESLAADYSDKWVTRIDEAIASCEYAYQQFHSESSAESVPAMVGQTIIAGDINRSTTEYDLASPKQRRKDWIAAGDDLAAIFGVVNYRAPELFRQLGTARRVR